MKCNKCIGAVGLPAIGHCSGCGAMIGRMSDTYCDQCSKTKNACAGCGVALAPASGSGAPADGAPTDGSEES
ncbi:MAG: hypothetical protein WC714_18115 [Candidatus Obscuribacterales bacterium]|jgi:predicted amidophosphoribosyltransferase